MISIGEERSLGENRTWAGALQGQLKTVRQCPDEPQRTSSDQEERRDGIAGPKQSLAGGEMLVALGELPKLID